MNLPRHWWIALGLAFGPAVATAFARFSYALVLPAMRSELGWTYAQAGWLNTVNALGYLAGALFTLRMVSRIGNRRFFCVGMVVTSIALIGSGSTAGFWPMLAWRALAGASSSAVFICGGVLAGNVLKRLADGSVDPRFAATAIAVFFAGGGAGIFVSGASIPWLLALRGDAAWPLAWTAMGVSSLFMSVAAIAAALQVEEPAAGRAQSDWPARRFVPQLASYFLFGLGYIAYMTFVIAWMKQHGAGPLEVSMTWSLLGLATLAAPVFWGPLLHRWPGGKPMAVAMGMLSVGAALPLASTHFAMMLLSALMVGSFVFNAPSSVTGFIKKSLPKAAWGRAMSAFTVAFALGQSLGPVVTGWLADLSGSLLPGLAASALALFAGCLVATRQRDLA